MTTGELQYTSRRIAEQAERTLTERRGVLASRDELGLSDAGWRARTLDYAAWLRGMAAQSEGAQRERFVNRHSGCIYWIRFETADRLCYPIPSLPR